MKQIKDVSISTSCTTKAAAPTSGKFKIHRAELIIWSFVTETVIDGEDKSVDVAEKTTDIQRFVTTNIGHGDLMDVKPKKSVVLAFDVKNRQACGQNYLSSCLEMMTKDRPHYIK